MENVINVLDIKVANLIAAGEVVDRPASVIKELLENSIDAHAENVTVEVKNGGVSLMRVTDDGIGMSREDATVCIKRHATSKIHDERDLNSIITLGFRGEALAAISAVSKTRIITRRRGDEIGTRIESEGGKVISVAETGCSEGTTIIVEELFANVPARKKFLKKDSSETMAITAVVEKIALSHPELSIKLICDGSLRYQTVGDGDLRSAAYAVLGREFAKHLLSVRGAENGIEVNGFVGSPDFIKSNRTQENFFINGRYIKSATASAALEAAFATYIPGDRFPACMLHIKIHPTLVDVNVHPTKMEVKFSNEKIVFDAVFSAVRGALVHNIERPDYAVEREKESKEEKNRLLTAFAPINDRASGTKNFVENRSLLDIECDETEEKKNQTDAVHKTVENKDELKQAESVGNVVASPDTLRKNEASEASELSETTEKSEKNDGIVKTETSYVSDVSAEARSYLDSLKATFDISAHKSEDISPYGGAISELKEDVKQKEAPFYKIIGVAADAYIFVELKDRVTVIDKHAAHERILFEQMKKNMYSQGDCMQILLFPLEISLSGDEMTAIEEYRGEIEKTGFDFEAKSNVAYVSKIPVELDNASAEAMFGEILHSLVSTGAGAMETRNLIYEKALFQASCKAAVKAGRYDDMSHIEWIVKEVMTRDEIKFCPHGRPVAFDITLHDIEHRFKRI